ncbi:MAG: cytochrome P450 [Bacteroidota bacterium]
MKKSEFSCPFQHARQTTGIGKMDDQNDPVVMVLRHKEVKQYAKDYETFQSGAKPGRIVVPSEVNIRDTRQIPFEVDPPLHADYRALVEDWFRRPFQPEYEAKLTVQIEALLDKILAKDQLEVVHELALPMQSNALTLLINVPFAEATTWIDWGTHVFRSEDNPLDNSKANILYDYLDEQIDKAEQTGGESMYSLLLNAEFQGRKLRREEIKGVMILTFAGGRDTVINAITNTIAYFAEHPKSLERIRQEPKIIHKATEELMRYFSPLTHMGRVVTQDTHVCEHAVKADTRISLCWAAANRDESVFKNPNEIDLNRRINPHVAFGFSHHQCLGAHHARKVIKVLMKVLAEKVQAIQITEAEENVETLGEFKRKVGFEKLVVKLIKKTIAHQVEVTPKPSTKSSFLHILKSRFSGWTERKI